MVMLFVHSCIWILTLLVDHFIDRIWYLVLLKAAAEVKNEDF